MLVEMALGVLEFLSNKPNWILSKGKSEMSFGLNFVRHGLDGNR